VFALLQHAQQLTLETGGAFDISIAPLVRCWGFMGGQGRMPTPEELAAAREKVGMHNVLLDATRRAVRFAREGVMLDLGAIGKGYAVARAADFLRDAGVTSALIHGGTSTICAIGVPPDAPAWKVAVDSASLPSEAQPLDPIVIALRDESLSISAASGRQFIHDGKRYGHVLDPRTGQPTEGALLAAVALPSATETDALSTALLTLGAAGQAVLAAMRPGTKSLVVSGAKESLQVLRHGL
jgi:FAD:protein FMN transferase